MQTIAEQFVDHVISGTLVTVDGVSVDELAVSFGAEFKCSNGVRLYVFSDNSSVALAPNMLECRK